MKSDHLSDEILQAFLLNELHDDAIASHLEVCPICTESLEKYQRLMAGISKIMPENFSFDVSMVVMGKINELEIRKERNTNRVLYMCLSIVSTIALILLFPYIKIVVTQFQLTSIMTNAFMLISVFGVVIFLLNDIFRQYKQKEMLLLQ